MGLSKHPRPLRERSEERGSKPCKSCCGLPRHSVKTIDIIQLRLALNVPPSLPINPADSQSNWQATSHSAWLVFPRNDMTFNQPSRHLPLRLLEYKNIFVSKNTKTTGKCSIAPQISSSAFSSFVTLNIFYNS